MFALVMFFLSVSFPSPGDLHSPGIKLMSPVCPALAGRFFTTGTTWEALVCVIRTICPSLDGPPTYQLGFFDCSTVWQYVAATYCHICLNGLPHILARQTFYSLSYIHLDPGNLFQLFFWYLRGGKNSDFAYCYKGFFCLSSSQRQENYLNPWHPWIFLWVPCFISRKQCSFYLAFKSKTFTNRKVRFTRT